MNDALRHSVAHLFRDSVDLAPGTAVALGDDAHHLETVLRVRPGAPVTVSDGRGGWIATTYAGTGRLIVDTPVRREAARPAALAVAFAPVKGDKVEWTVEKLVEVGLDRIVVLAPLRRSVVVWDAARASAQYRKLERTVLAAASQSRRVHLPALEVGVAMSSLAGPGAAVAEPGGPEPSDEVATIVVGPEGGFDPAEIQGWPTVGLGPGVLRAETAAVAAGVLMVTRTRRMGDHTV